MARSAVAILLFALFQFVVNAQAAELDLVTYNVWHGLRTQGKLQFGGEGPERRELRVTSQIESLRELDADIFLFQEVNPAPRLSRRYASELGRDVIHKVTDCGIKLGPLRLPRNIRSGIAILARPGLGLRKIGVKRLSGPGGCFGDHIGLQFGESRHALIGEISVSGRRLLVVTTHIHNFPYGRAEFADRLTALRDSGEITPEQLAEVEKARARHTERQRKEIGRLLAEIERLRSSGSYDGVILGGDFNAGPGSPVLKPILERFVSAAAATGTTEPTADPVRNEANHSLGRREGFPYPTFDSMEVERIYHEEEARSRQIDHLFLDGLTPVSSAVILDTPRDGRYLSDHFALRAGVRLD